MGHFSIYFKHHHMSMILTFIGVDSAVSSCTFIIFIIAILYRSEAPQHKLFVIQPYVFSYHPAIK